MRTVKTLIRMGGCTGWSESWLGAQSHCWFCHVAAHLFPSILLALKFLYFWIILFSIATEHGCRNAKIRKALLNLNIHNSYFSHAVNYSHEYVTFWYVLNIRTTNFEILIGTKFSQMFEFRRVKNSQVFVTPVKNSFEFFHMCDKYVRILHTCDRFVRMWMSNESVTSVNNSNVFDTPVKNMCEFFTDVTNTCESFTSVKDSQEYFTSVIRTHDMCDKFIKKEYL